MDHLASRLRDVSVWILIVSSVRLAVWLPLSDAGQRLRGLAPPTSASKARCQDPGCSFRRAMQAGRDLPEVIDNGSVRVIRPEHGEDVAPDRTPSG